MTNIGVSEGDACDINSNITHMKGVNGIVSSISCGYSNNSITS